MRELERPERRRAAAVDRWSGSRHVVQVRPHVWGWVAARVRSENVLEIGPGLRPTAPIATSSFVDVSPHALAILERHGATTREAAERLPFEPNAFDAALAFEVLEHVEDDRSLLDEIARVIRPGGLFLLSTPVHAARWSTLDDACEHVRRDEPEELFGKLRTAGLEPGGYAWSPPPRRAVTAVRAAALTRDRRLATAFVQRWIFPIQAAYQRRFARLRWTDPDVPVPPAADDLLVWTRRRDGGAERTG